LSLVIHDSKSCPNNAVSLNAQIESHLTNAADIQLHIGLSFAGFNSSDKAKGAAGATRIT